MTRFLPVAAFLFVGACGPSDVVGKSKLEPIEEGMALEAVSAVIGKGPLMPNQPADSLRLFKGYRTQVFLLNGQQYRVIWYREEPGTVEQEIVRERETPILLDGGNKVVAKGWAEFDDKATELNIPNPYRSRERLDSISEAQLKLGRKQ